MPYFAQANINLPASAAEHAANDVVAGLFRLEGIGKPNENIIITEAQLYVGAGSVPAGMTSFRAYQFGGMPSVIADNAAMSIALADIPVAQGYIDLGSPADEGASLLAQSGQVNKPARCDKNGDLYFYIKTNGTYTPAAGSEQYTLKAFAIPVVG